MTQLFSTLSRAALVAVGLSVAPAAFAQGTLSCPTGFTPLVNGNEVTCQMACATGTPTPVINGTSLSFTCGGGGGGDAAPGSCTLTSSAGTTITAGGSTTLTARCNTGSPTDLTLTWTTPSGSASCPTTGTVGQNATCTVSGIQQGGTWSVKFGNGVGSDVTKTLAYSVTQGGGGSGEYALCSAAGVSVAQGFSYPARNVYTNQYGSLGQGEGLVFKMVVTQQRSGGGQWFGNYGGVKEWALTTTACDFSGATTVQGQQGRASIFSPSYNLAPGTYYFNVREIQGCNAGDCNMNGKLN